MSVAISVILVTLVIFSVSFGLLYSIWSFVKVFSWVSMKTGEVLWTSIWGGLVVTLITILLAGAIFG